MPGGGTQETTSTAEPWGPTQGYLKNMLPVAQNMFNNGQFSPETFGQARGLSTLAPQSAATHEAQYGTAQQARRDMQGGTILDTAQDSVGRLANGTWNGASQAGFRGMFGEQQSGPVGTAMNGMQQSAVGGLRGLMSGRNAMTSAGAGAFQRELGSGAVDTSRTGMQRAATGDMRGFADNGMGASLQGNGALSGGLAGLMQAQSGKPSMTFADISQQLQGAKDRALAGAIPAAAAQFTGSGLGNSSVAQEAVGRSAIDAIAPYEYSAAEQGLNRAMTAAENAQQRALSASNSLAGFGDAQQARQLGLDTADAQFRYGASSDLNSIGTQQQMLGYDAANTERSRDMQAGGALAGIGQAQQGMQLNASNSLGQMGAQQQNLRYNSESANRDRNMSASSALMGMGSDADRMRLQASLAAPGAYSSGYLPQQMLGQVGAQRDARGQAERDAAVNAYYDRANRPQENLQGYLNTLMGVGGMGGTQTQQAPGASGLQQVAGAGLGGLGAYGALAANPATAPFALAGGGLAGLMGLF